MDLFKGWRVGRLNTVVTHLQFVDDTIIFCEGGDPLKARQLKEVIKLFEHMSKLKINFEKSCVAGMNLEQEELEEVAESFGCPITVWPLKYLGMPLGDNPKESRFWNPVVERCSKRLAAWKRNYISMGGTGWDAGVSSRATLASPWKSICGVLPQFLSQIRNLEAVARSSATRSKPVVGCKPLDEGFIKLNFDGCSLWNPGPAGIGGVFRNYEGHVIAMFSGPVGVGDSVFAEFQAVLQGVKLARDLTYDRLLIEVIDVSGKSSFKFLVSNVFSFLEIQFKPGRFFCTGMIPESIGNCTKLEELYLIENQLVGVLPKSLNNLQFLAYLDVSSNRLEGRIKLGGSGNCRNLQELVLTYNQFDGEIPSGLGNCSGLRFLAALDNKLIGQIPSFGILTKLELLYLNENSLSRVIPPEIGTCSSLKELLLQKNQLEGKITNISLSQNNLSGELPLEIPTLNVSDDEAEKGPNAVEALRAQVNAEERDEQTSSSSGSSENSSESGVGVGAVAVTVKRAMKIQSILFEISK
ncbi:PREDICTED: probable LRR receptor-like serine/threonine-protein kinase At4g36180 [Nelumbo nucifera]|uniref:Probable LRR receptor-like serine/threonine-protein kinase At4g36180 n=1 Tax=Nelumbo nucifera TaxID=4432 RepID=A0A1U8Q523_NELNU|nr:PREDICTED: probable LRR receptor-like serine/threonine-protein kinase At4g36180 [Nelumbo nucifera]